MPITIQTACSFSFSITAWNAVNSHVTSAEQWQQWATRRLDIKGLPEYEPASSFLPAMQRRHLGASTWLVYEVTWGLANAYPNCLPVCVSHGGEVNRSFKSWLELLRSGAVSPTSSGPSVHNAQAGQWSILHGDMQGSTALVTFSDGIKTALAEAYAALCDDAERILLVTADDPLRTDYTVTAEHASSPYALAMVLERGNIYRLTPELAGRLSEGTKSYWGALDWIRFVLSDGLKQSRSYTGRIRHW